MIAVPIPPWILRDVGVVDVVALAGARNALDARDHGLAVIRVLERDGDASRPDESAAGGTTSKASM